MVESQLDDLAPSQTAGEQKDEQSAVGFALDAGTVRSLPKRLSLLFREPVAEANSNLLHTLDSSDACR